MIVEAGTSDVMCFLSVRLHAHFSVRSFYLQSVCYMNFSVVERGERTFVAYFGTIAVAYHYDSGR